MLQGEKTVKGLLKIKWDISRKEQQDAARYIVQISQLLAHLRGTVNIRQSKVWASRNKEQPNTPIEDDIDFYIDSPIIEIPTRAATILRNIAVGHAISQGRDYYNMIDIPLVVKTGLCSAMLRRVLLFQELIKNEGKLTTTEVCDKLRFAIPTARLVMREFSALEITDLQLTGYRNTGYQIKLNPKFNWFLTTEFKGLGIELAEPTNFKPDNEPVSDDIEAQEAPKEEGNFS